jgi:RNA polymerase sigma-70 factor (ECF subfamily)
MYPRVFSFAMKLTKNPQDAADLTQETFVRAFSARDRRWSDREPDAWFFRITYRCFLDTKRTQRRRPQTVSVEQLSKDNCVFEPMDDAPDPEQTFFQNKFSAPLMSAISALTEDQRQLIQLATLGEMTHKELAARFGCGATTIKTRIHRAHTALRRKLLSFGFDAATLNGLGTA